MPRFQLLIRELGKAPRVVPLTQPLVVGRSRRADVVIDDEEVSREQFRVEPSGALVVLEGLGKTNRTTVDGTVVEAGQRVTLNAGASIKIGRTVVMVQAGDATESAPSRPGNFDATMIAPGPAKGGPGLPPPAAEQEQTGGFAGPQGARTTAGGPPPQQATRPPADADADDGRTMNVKGGFRPGQAGPAPVPPAPAPRPAPPSPTDEVPGQTMQVKGGFRPGQPPVAPVPPATTKPPAPPTDAGVPNVTMQMPGGFRPGQASARPAEPPRPTPAAPTPGPGPAAATPASPAAPSAPAPTPAPAAKGDASARPKTVFVQPQDVGALTGQPAAAAGPDVEARLHQAMPRLFVKGDTLRRRVRLMKARTKVGRAETADVLLPNESVSELHAEIDFDGTTWTLRDCGSTNGTLLDGNVLRGLTAPIARHALLGFGNLRGIFLVNDAATAELDRRHEERALKLLVAAGRLPKDVGKQVVALARRDRTQSICEILLGDTPIEPADWANAITAVKGRVTLLDRLRALFTRKPKPPAR